MRDFWKKYGRLFVLCPLIAIGLTAAIFAVMIIPRVGDFKVSHIWVLDASPQTDHQIALNYLNPNNKPHKFDEAVMLLERAANAGYVLAQHDLAYWYSYDPLNTGPRDFAKAEHWYRQAAAQGYDKSVYNLGYLLMSQENEEEGLPLVQQSAETGNPEAQHSLAHWYTQEDNPEKDLQQAEDWYKKAIAQNHAGAMFNLGLIYKERGDFEAAIPLFEKAYQGGTKKAANSLGDIYYRGPAPYNNMEKAVEWYAYTAEDGSVNNQMWLGKIYMQGEIVAEDLEKAEYWFLKAAESEEPRALFYAGNLLTRRGFDVEDTTERVELFQRGMTMINEAAKQGDKNAKGVIQKFRDLCVNGEEDVKSMGCFLTALIGHSYAISYVKNTMINKAQE